MVFISHGGYEPQYGKSSGYGAKINEKTCPNPVFWNYQKFRSSSVIANISNYFLINTKCIDILIINTISDSEKENLCHLFISTMKDTKDTIKFILQCNICDQNLKVR